MGGLYPERIVMSRNLVVCCDGTWSDADKMKARERTNVWRIYDAVAGVERETKFYIAGVGTKNLVDKFFLGGLFGVGVEEPISRGCNHDGVNDEDGRAHLAQPLVDH